MVGNVRFKLTLGSPEDSGFLCNYPNEQRSGSFLQDGERRIFSSRIGLAKWNATDGGFASIVRVFDTETDYNGGSAIPVIGLVKKGSGVLFWEHCQRQFF